MRAIIITLCTNNALNDTIKAHIINTYTTIMPITGTFRAANILPSHPSEGNPIEILRRKIAKAKELGCNYVWINPITTFKEETECRRICNDTGLLTVLYGSLYAPNDPNEVRDDFPIELTRAMNLSAKSTGIEVLVDFVWKHVSVNSALVDHHKDWFKETPIKDIVEYKFTDPKITEEILRHLKKSIDLYLDPKKGFGFAGLRIDAASHLNVYVRRVLISYIRSEYPEAVILEEFLFDSNQSHNVTLLNQDALTHDLFSDVITSNLYYQRQNVHGGLPTLQNMGDVEKLKLAQGRGIGFTGNHDHLSASDGTRYSMAMHRAASFDAFKERIRQVTTTPLKHDQINSSTIDDLIGILDNTNHRKSKRSRDDTGPMCIEMLDNCGIEYVRYLLPFANDIARELLDVKSSNYNRLLDTFRVLLFERIANRTLASMSGYFFLYTDMVTLFETQRIFVNKVGEPLPNLLLTIEDLKSEPAVTAKIIESMRHDTDRYNFFSIFEKAVPLAPNKATKTKARKSAEEPSNFDDNYRIWLPLIIEYLRNNPALNEYSFYRTKGQADALVSDLTKRLELEKFIKGINEIYSNLTSIECLGLETFVSLDEIKVIIRCSEQSTDIIIINLGDRIYTVDEIDLEKIALWYQTRLYPQERGKEVVLGKPFTSEPKVNPADGYLAHHGPAVAKAYMRVLGKLAGHQTNLYLGYNFNINRLDNYPDVTIKTHLKTDVQLQHEVLSSVVATEAALSGSSISEASSPTAEVIAATPAVGSVSTRSPDSRRRLAMQSNPRYDAYLASKALRAPDKKGSNLSSSLPLEMMLFACGDNPKQNSVDVVSSDTLKSSLS